MEHPKPQTLNPTSKNLHQASAVESVQHRAQPCLGASHAVQAPSAGFSPSQEAPPLAEHAFAANKRTAASSPVSPAPKRTMLIQVTPCPSTLNPSPATYPSNLSGRPHPAKKLNSVPRASEITPPRHRRVGNARV